VSKFKERARSKYQRAGLTCFVSVLLDNLDKTTRTEVADAIDDPAIKASWISRQLEEDGLLLPDGRKLSDGVITRHRRQECTCRINKPKAVAS
jgi:hypothetical protein